MNHLNNSRKEIEIGKELRFPIFNYKFLFKSPKIMESQLVIALKVKTQPK